MSEVTDNKANRIRVLKDIIKHLHAGNPPSKCNDKCRKSFIVPDAFQKRILPNAARRAMNSRFSDHE